MIMPFFDHVWQVASQYYGVDWLVMVTGLLNIYLIGDKNKAGFLVGMLSAALGLVFSVQIGSIANGITTVLIFLLFVRGYRRWVVMEKRA